MEDLTSTRHDTPRPIRSLALDGGGFIIAGNDAPIYPFGLALHLELEGYVDAGLTSFQARQTAGVNAARATRDVSDGMDVR